MSAAQAMPIPSPPPPATSGSREVRTCASCGLVQFATLSRCCRRCRQPYDPDPPRPAAPAPLAIRQPLPGVVQWFDVGVVVRALRLAKGWTMRQLSRRAHSPACVICRVELGQEMPTVDTLLRLCRALEIAPAVLLSIATDPRLLAAVKGRKA